MGLLTSGEPLTWEETKKWQEHVREHGVQQFINLYKKLENRCGDVLKWGDEVEYNLIKIDGNEEKAKLLLKAPDVLAILQKPENRGEKDLASLWRPEFAAYMVEGTPGTPYGSCVEEFANVEKNMRKRRKDVANILGPGEHVFSMSGFPRIGCPGFTEPSHVADPSESHTRSLFWPSEATFPGHPRFKTLSRNIRQRRGQKVIINVPVFWDRKTIDPYELERDILFGETQEPESKESPKPGHVYADAMGFGMGLSCLQLTFQSCGLFEAEMLYDQLTPMCPIMLAMTASTPFLRGYLTDVDCRWDIICASVDCRTKEERGEEPLKHSKFVIPKSRYSSVSCYLSVCAEKYKYNDVPLVYDSKVFDALVNAGIRESVAMHIAHLFIRDTVSLFGEKLHQDDVKDTDHFENIQSTNWQSMRFKPPPPNSDIGWRVEFRPCDLQFNDFENAAVCCFVVILTRVILSFKYNLLIPISLVDENMKRAQKRDAITSQKFYFRSNINSLNDGSHPIVNEKGRKVCFLSAKPDIEEFTMDQIFNGCQEKNFPGLLAFVKEYMRSLEIDTDTACCLTRYWNYLRDKAKGKLRTNARFMRDYIRSHPDYKHDSIISEKIQYDLLNLISKLQKDEKKFLQSLRVPGRWSDGT